MSSNSFNRDSLVKLFSVGPENPPNPFFPYGCVKRFDNCTQVGFFYIGLFVFVGVSFLSIGIIREGFVHGTSHCTYNLAIFALVFGSLLELLIILVSIWSISLSCIPPNRVDRIELVNHSFEFFCSLISVLSLTWLCIGTYWVFETNPSDCQHDLYNNSSHIIATVWSFILALVVAGCAVSRLTTFVRSRRGTQTILEEEAWKKTIDEKTPILQAPQLLPDEIL